MLRRIAKSLLYLLLVLFVGAAAVYAVLAFSSGNKAEMKPVFPHIKRRPLVMAHRGGGGLAPENTLEAFRNSMKLGVDVLELDFQLTRDGEMVVIHDGSVDRTTDGTGPVGEKSLEEIRQLDAGFDFSPDGGETFPYRGKGVRIPTLSEVLNAFPGMSFNIEAKRGDPSQAARLCTLLREKSVTERVVIASGNDEYLSAFRKECPEIPTSGGFSEVTGFLARYKTGLAESYSPSMQLLQVPERAGVQIVDKGFVEAARDRGMLVHVWTVNSPERMQRIMDYNVDGIMTDYPDRLLKFLER